MFNALAGVICSLASIGVVQHDQSTAAVPARLDAFLAPIVTRGDFSGTILLAKNGRVLFEKSYGKANFSLDVPITARTQFRIASVSKQFVAAGILLLRDKGALQLTDSVAKYIPELPTLEGVTLQHLLTHTSGLPADIGDLTDDLCRSRTPKDLIELFRSTTPTAPPGVKYRYSNFEYALLALVIERVTHQPYGAFLRQEIFQPLGMLSTGVDDGHSVIPNLASGYELGVTGMEVAGCWDISNSIGSGAVYSTARDLLIWAEALRAGRFLSDAARRDMFTPHLRNAGLGVFISTRGGQQVVEHNGRLPGFVAALSICPDSGLVLVIVGNAGTGASDVIRQSFPGLELGQAVDQPPRYVPRTMAPPKPDRLSGRYAFSPGSVLLISQTDDRVVVGFSGRPSVALTPVSDSEFFVRSLYARVVFEFDERGIASAARWIQNGTESRATRMTSP
jgi:CubicO group peptidase (beta-lactamase class C family)